MKAKFKKGQIVQIIGKGTQFAKDNKFIPEYYSKITRKING